MPDYKENIDSKRTDGKLLMIEILKKSKLLISKMPKTCVCNKFHNWFRLH